MPYSWSARLRRAVGDAVECLLLPAVAVVLPWRWTFRLYRRLAESAVFVPELTANALAGAQAWRPVPDPRAWAVAFRLTFLVDAADFFLLPTRSDAWIDRHIRLEGDPWPETPFMAVTFHYGVAVWAIRHMRRAGWRVSLLSNPVDKATYGKAWLRYAMACWRMREFARTSGAPVIYTGGSRAAMHDALRAGVCVTGAIDLPGSRTRDAVRVEFLGREAWFPASLLRIARAESVPVVVYSMAHEHATGMRTLRVRRVPCGDDASQVAFIVGELETLITRNPTAWHFWSMLPLFFVPPSGVAVEGHHVNA